MLCRDIGSILSQKEPSDKPGTIHTALRYGAPDVFAFLVENIDPARQEPKESGIKNALDVRPAWKRLLATHSEHRAIQRLVDLLGLEQVSKKKLFQGGEIIQGVESAEYPDYFRRILSEQLAPGEVPDQQILRDLQAWRSGNSTRMLDMLKGASADHDSYLRSWRPLARGLSAEELHALGSALIADALQRGSSLKVDDCPALMAVWNKFNATELPPSHIDWIGDQIRRSMPVSITFANELFYYFGGERASQRSHDERLSLRKAILDAAMKAFTTWEHLARALGENRYSIRRLMFASGDEFYSELQEWRWLIPIVMEGARADGRRFAPQLVALIGDYSEHVVFPNRVQEYSVNEARAKDVFGDDLEEALTLASTAQGDDPYLQNAVTHIKGRLQASAAASSAEASSV